MKCEHCDKTPDDGIMDIFYVVHVQNTTVFIVQMHGYFTVTS